MVSCLLGTPKPSGNTENFREFLMLPAEGAEALSAANLVNMKIHADGKLFVLKNKGDTLKLQSGKHKKRPPQGVALKF